MSEQPAPNIKDIIKQEYMKCMMDPVHFMRKYCYIQHPKKGRILFHLYPFQESVLNEVRNNNYNIINKSRQLGISTLVAGFSLWLMLFHQDKTILCIATKQDTAKSMVTKVSYMYDNLPTWLRGPKKPLENNKLSLKLANGSQIVASSAAPDAGRSYAVSLLIIDEAAFITDIDKIYTAIKPTIATGGRCIALSSPNGVGNWFHKKWVESIDGKQGSFHHILLNWDVHPERDIKWYNEEKANFSPREFAQEYECDFLGSGHTVVNGEMLKFAEMTWVKEPIEKRFMGGDFWLWQWVDYSKQYIIVADVARGDGSDFSTFHILDIEECEQVGEFKSQIGTREFGHMLVSVATEWNNALLVIENASVGWDVVNTVIERGYSNLYYSPRSYGEMHMEKYLAKLDSEQVVPGFTTSSKTRPLVISKLESYIREGTFIFHSARLLEELRVFIWLNNKAQASHGYNDDLVMALAIGLFLRDTAVKFQKQGQVMSRWALDNIQVNNYSNNNYPVNPRGAFQNPYKMYVNGQAEDISWVLN
jgi:hypothetical protein